ncbi:MAG: ATP synthase F0 subunit B [Pseudomonadota bacterium]|nr:ATP synthase F0 subunit B [Pseudomonadota bacterium]
MNLFLLRAAAWASEGAAPGEGAHGAAAAGHEAHGIPWDLITLQAANVVLFGIALVWLARGPVRDALKNRSLAVSKQLDESARLKAEAAATAAEIEARLASLDRRVDEMKAEAAVEADLEALRIAERAQADAARIKDTAERTIREESARARNELRGEAARLAVALARETLKRSVTADDQDRLAREFLAAVEKETPNG